MIGQVEKLDFEMYDVAVKILNANQISEDTAAAIQFRIVYISEDYTLMQITMRLTFCVISCIVYMSYATKLLCRIPDEEKK